MKVIIVGAGEVGFHIASHLALENKDVVVIDKDPAAIRYVSDNIDVQTIIAFIAELQRLGLIIPASNESIERKTNEVENNFEKTNEMIQIPRHEWFC